MAKKEQTLAIPQQKQSFSKMIRKNKYYFLMALPAVISTFIFCYIPMYGVLIAFQDYHVGDSILGGEWVGLKHFFEYFSPTHSPPRMLSD